MVMRNKLEKNSFVVLSGLSCLGILLNCCENSVLLSAIVWLSYSPPCVIVNLLSSMLVSHTSLLSAYSTLFGVYLAEKLSGQSSIESNGPFSATESKLA